MKLFNVFVLSAALLCIGSDAAVLRRNGRRRVVKVNGKRARQGRGFGARVALPPAPLPALTPIPPPAPVPLIAQPLQLIEVTAPAPASFSLGSRAASTSYGAARAASTSYGAAIAEPLPAPVEIIEVRTVPEPAPIVVAEPARSLYNVPRTAASERVTVNAAPKAKPVAITRSVYNAPGTRLDTPDNWNYEFEAENGIKQQATGEMRSLGDAQVMVMRGSYEYIGADGLTYTVDWEADENGFRASAPHLPKPVEIPFPEQAEAVAAQIRFAAEEEAARLRTAASSTTSLYSSPESAATIVEARAPLASYGQERQLPQYTSRK